MLLFHPWLLFLLLQIYYWKAQSSSKRNRRHIEKKILTFQGSKTHGMLPGLEPFSNYTLNIRVVNGKGEGPASPDRVFGTPEGGMRWTCLWDPSNIWHRLRGSGWQNDPDKVCCGSQMWLSWRWTQHAQSWQSISLYADWGCEACRSQNAALKSHLSWLKHFSPYLVTLSETLLIWCLFGSLTCWLGSKLYNFYKPQFPHLKSMETKCEILRKIPRKENNSVNDGLVHFL